MRFGYQVQLALFAAKYLIDRGQVFYTMVDIYDGLNWSEAERVKPDEYPERLLDKYSILRKPWVFGNDPLRRSYGRDFAPDGVETDGDSLEAGFDEKTLLIHRSGGLVKA